MSTLREGLKDIVPKLGLKVEDIPDEAQAPIGQDILDVEVLNERKETLGNASKALYRTISAKFEPKPFSYKRKCGKPTVLEVSKVLEKVQKQGLSYQTLRCLRQLSRGDDGSLNRYVTFDEIESYIRKESGIENNRIKTKTIDSFLHFFRKANIISQITNQNGRVYCFNGAKGSLDTDVAYAAYLDNIRHPKGASKAAHQTLKDGLIRCGCEKQDDNGTVTRQEFDDLKQSVKAQMHEMLMMYGELREVMRKDVIRRYGLTPEEIDLITRGGSNT